MLSGFKHFTDYRCFHFCRRDITHLGRTVNVGICECKPDAMAQVWGDTKLRPGLEAFVILAFVMLGVFSFFFPTILSALPLTSQVQLFQS